MANSQGPRRNGVIGFVMGNAPAPIRPPTPALSRNGPIGFQMVPPPALPRNGPIGFQMVTRHDTANVSMNTTNSQDPPHRNTPLAGPDTAQSLLGHANVQVTNSQLGRFETSLLETVSMSNVATNSAREAQREISALNNKLEDAETTIAQQEIEKRKLEKDNARAQAIARGIREAAQEEVARISHQNMVFEINRASNNRGNEIEAQFEILEDRLKQASCDLELARGKIAALESLKHKLSEELKDWHELSQVVESTEVNKRQRRERISRGEEMVGKLICRQELLHRDAMWSSRLNPVRTDGQPKAQSSIDSAAATIRRVADVQAPRSAQARSVQQTRQSDSQVMQLQQQATAASTVPTTINTPATPAIATTRVQTHECFDLSNPFLKEYRSSEPQIQGPGNQDSETAHGDASQRESGSSLSDGSGSDGQTDSSGDEEFDVSMTDAPKTSIEVSCDMSWETQDSSPESTPLLVEEDSMDLCDGDEVMNDISAVECMNVVLEVSAVQDIPLAVHNFFQQKEIIDKMQLSCLRFYIEIRAINNGVPVEFCFVVKTQPYPFTIPPHPSTIELPSRKRSLHEFLVDIRKQEDPESEQTRKKQVTEEMVNGDTGSTLLALSAAILTDPVPDVPDMSVPAVSQPTQFEKFVTEEVQPQAAMSVPAVTQPTQVVEESPETVPTEEVPTTQAAMSVPAVSQPAQAVLEPTETVQIEKVPIEEAVSEPAVSQPTPADLEATLPDSTVSVSSDDVVGAPAPSEPAPTESALTSPTPAEEVLKEAAITQPTFDESDLGWETEKPGMPSLRTANRSHLDVLLSRRSESTRPRDNVLSSFEELQVTATSRVSASSLVASPEDASAKNAVATETDSRAGVSKGTKRVEKAEIPTSSAQKAAGEQREELGGEEAATDPQMPGAWPSNPLAVTASNESDMQEGSALLKKLWTGAGRLSFGVFLLVMVALLTFPLWAGHLGHLVYALEGPEQFLDELRWEHGFDVPFMERLIYVFLRCFAGDRTTFG
ncbi:hypothetical protein N7475_001371 [Penicillium sp. IBT 31633x]|nr:hypothetical protein N7475_001371 [Penicillium sp. IBT 31633x]